MVQFSHPRGFPGGSAGKEEIWVDPWVGKIPWRRAWQPTPVFLPGESPRTEEPSSYSPWGHKQSDTTGRLSAAQLTLIMTTGKATALTRQTLVSKVMPLVLNMLSRFIIAILPRSKCLLISWMQSLSTMILEPKKIVCHCFHCFSFICHEVMGLDATIFVF